MYIGYDVFPIVRANPIASIFDHLSPPPHCIEATPLYNGYMGYRRDVFQLGEWYHCFNRGVDKRIVFEEDSDYQRFLEALYLSNSKTTDPRGSFQRLPHDDVMALPRQEPIVAVGAYCLMPNHYHLLLKEIVEGGIRTFMHRVNTGYTMYFNIRRERTGNLFVKPFRSKHIRDDRYFKRVASYIHLNPVELFEPRWKKGTLIRPNALEVRLREYRYSSLPEYCGEKRVYGSLLDRESVSLLSAEKESLCYLLQDRTAYYQELGIDV